jgi:uncharacterized protein
MNTSASDRQLSAEELDELENLLNSAHPEDSMLVDELDGFCAAAATSPEPVDEGRFLHEVLGDTTEAVASRLSASEHARLLELVGRHRRSVLARLGGERAFEAVLGVSEDGQALADAWAVGYLRGFNLQPDSWEPLDDDEVCVEAFELILRFADESDLEAEGNESEPIADEERDELVDLMIEGAQELFVRLAPARERALKPATFRHNGAQPGRNDPCPCGSGRKFKVCHGR